MCTRSDYPSMDDYTIFAVFFSNELDCNMNFAIYIPPQANLGKVPVLYWLSGICVIN